MVVLLRNTAGEIVSISDTAFVTAPGQTQEQAEGSMAAWAEVFRLSADTLTILADGVDAAVITVEVNTQSPPASLDLEVNEAIHTVTLVNGTGALAVDAVVPGTITIRPADRVTYCAAGQGTLTITAI